MAVDELRPGRPIEATTQDIIEEIRGIVTENRREAMRVSAEWVHNILQKRFNMQKLPVR